MCLVAEQNLYQFVPFAEQSLCGSPATCGSFRVSGRAGDSGTESSPGLMDSARLRASPGLRCTPGFVFVWNCLCIQLNGPRRTDNMELRQAVEWSRQENVDLSYAIVLGKVPRETADEVILGVLGTVKVFGRTRIRGRRVDSSGKRAFVLVETSTMLEQFTLPSEVGIDGEIGPWPVHLVSSLEAADSSSRDEAFHSKLCTLLKQEGKSMDDVMAFAQANPVPKADLSADLVSAIGKLIDKCGQVSPDGPSYRKLRLFSGVRPVLPGEEEYEGWVEQATQMVSEWQCNEAAKKQRIAESLRGPAADIIRFLKVSNPSATVTDYLAALDTAYGTTESGTDLMAKFRYTYQEKGEKLSAFLYRLDKLLHKALSKGGIEPADLDKVRMDQLVKGAQTGDMVALRLRLTHALREPPSFSQLLREVREEEEWIQSREAVKAGIATTTVSQSSKTSELDGLRREVKELSGQVAKLLNVATVRSTTSGSAKETESVHPKVREEASSEKTKSQPKMTGIFCYRCGEDGHTKRECKGAEDLRRVNRKLIDRMQGNFTGALTQGGEQFLNTLTIHPIIKKAYESLKDTVVSSEESDQKGTVWFVQYNPVTLQPSQVLRVAGVPKLTGELTNSFLLVDQAEAVNNSAEVQVRPEVHSASVLSQKRVVVTVRNVSSKPVVLRRGTPLANIFPVTMVPQLKAPTSETTSTLSPSSFDFGDSPMPEEAKQRLCQKMLERREVFSCHEWDVGCSKSTKHEIRLTDPKPFRERSRRLAPADIEDVRKHLQELKENGIISDSRSPYASPIVVVRKKSGKVRMCVDYRTLNQRTIPDQYTVPRIEDALHSLSGSKWFTVLDLRSGYYQIPMSEADKEKTAFICPLGFYKFERMPQGICGAPATFQRVMERTVGDMNFLEVLVYLDDLIIFGKTLEEHEERLLKVLDRLRDEGLKLSLDKCQFGRTSVTYVGHIVSQDGIATDPSKIEAVSAWPKPQTLSELRSFLGFCGYYRRFVKDYSRICRPLNELLQGCSSHSRLTKDGKPVHGKVHVKSSEPFGSRWTVECDSAFEELKAKLTQTPVLAFADTQKPYVLHVDASLDGLGGVLYQEHDNKLRPVAFISRSLSPSEKRYPAHKLEFLALKWAVVDKLHDYLYGVPFEVRTDNNPLTYIMTSAKLDATGHRWLSALSTYDFSLKYRPGRKNIDADSLSRRPHASLSLDDDWQEISAPGVRAMCQGMFIDSRMSSQPSCLVNHMGVHVSAIPEVYCQSTRVGVDPLPTFSKDAIQTAQRSDSCIGEVWLAFSRGRPVTSVQTKHPDIKVLKREWEKLSLEHGLLYRTIKLADQRARQQLVLPKQFHSTVLKSLHDDSGHLGFDKTYALVRDRFFWPRMKRDVEAYCQTCDRCIKRKTLPHRAATLSHMSSSGPMDLVCIDFLTIEPDSQNICNVLVVTDHFTRYAQAFPTKDQKAVTVARTLWEKYFIHYGLPTRIHSDQGRDFESRLIHEMLTMLGVKKSRTSPYHPQGDPQPERFNRTLLDMLGTLSTQQKSKWSKHITHLVHAYNCTPNEATGFSPYYLLFGREARLPIDVCFRISADGASTSSHMKYVSRMRSELRQAYQLAQATSAKMNMNNKLRYDQKVRYHCLSPGDRVLIRNLGLKGKQKLADRWGSDPYVVESKLSDLPVYRLKPMNGVGPSKVMHRNHLLPLGQAVRLSPEVHSSPVPSPRPLRQRKVKDLNTSSEPKTTEPSEDLECAIQSLSDSESEYGCYAEGLVQNTQAEEEQSREPIIESDHSPLDVAAPLECDPLDTLPEALVSSPVNEVEDSQGERRTDDHHSTAKFTGCMCLVAEQNLYQFVPFAEQSLCGSPATCGSFRVSGRAGDSGTESSPGLMDSARLRASPGLRCTPGFVFVWNCLCIQLNGPRRFLRSFPAPQPTAQALSKVFHVPQDRVTVDSLLLEAGTTTPLCLKNRDFPFNLIPRILVALTLKDTMAGMLFLVDSLNLDCLCPPKPPESKSILCEIEALYLQFSFDETPSCSDITEDRTCRENPQLTVIGALRTRLEQSLQSVAEHLLNSYSPDALAHDFSDYVSAAKNKLSEDETLSMLKSVMLSCSESISVKNKDSVSTISRSLFTKALPGRLLTELSDICKLMLSNSGKRDSATIENDPMEDVEVTTTQAEENPQEELDLFDDGDGAHQSTNAAQKSNGDSADYQHGLGAESPLSQVLLTNQDLAFLSTLEFLSSCVSFELGHGLAFKPLEIRRRLLKLLDLLDCSKPLHLRMYLLLLKELPAEETSLTAEEFDALLRPLADVCSLYRQDQEVCSSVLLALLPCVRCLGRVRGSTEEDDEMDHVRGALLKVVSGFRLFLEKGQSGGQKKMLPLKNQQTAFENVYLRAQEGMKIQSNRAPEDLPDETFNRRATLLKSLSVVMCCSPVCEKQALFALLQSYKVNGIEEQLIKKVLAGVSQSLGYKSSKAFVWSHLYYLVAEWLGQRETDPSYTLQSFPYMLLSYSTLEEFY
ncbi:hypothetical protein NFI96_009730, partial [Prochilodus magdalenae]